jgi:hypothetical protein
VRGGVRVRGRRTHGIRVDHDDHGRRYYLNLDPADLLTGIGLPGPLREPLGLAEFDLADARAAGCDLSPVRAALHSKKTLAWLSEGRPWMSPRERALADRYLPWTRTVGDRSAWWRGRRYDLPQLLTAHRERFVLKGATGCSGLEVVFGAQTEPGDWARQVELAVRTGYPVAQEVVVSATTPVDVLFESGEIARLAASSVLSPFCVGGAPAGGLARFAPAGPPGLVRVADGAVLTGLLAEA